MSLYFNPWPIKPKFLARKLIVREKDKMVILISNEGKVIIPCDKDDKFDWRIGFGLALSNFHNKNMMYKRIREFYRKNGKLKVKPYAEWCVRQWSGDNPIVEELVAKDIKEKGWCQLDAYRICL